MTSGVLFQILFNLVLLAGVVFLWVKLNRPQKDDPRLSRGLQLLQSKIAVLEDLSDQIESQVLQITTLMEVKAKEVQGQILAADKQIQKIEASMGKSMDVAKIFQDRIPHQEIIERQNTLKYVKAARLAHQGFSTNEIAEQIDLSRGEIEMIAKVNRDQLQFSEEDLPEWVKSENDGGLTGPQASTTDHQIQTKKLFSNETSSMNQEGILENQMLARLTDRADFTLQGDADEFVSAPAQFVVEKANLAAVGDRLRAATSAAVAELNAANVTTQNAAPSASMSSQALSAQVRTVTFPRISESSRSLAASSTAEVKNRPSALPKIEMPTQPPTPKSAAVVERAQTTTGKDVEIRKVVFPRIDMNQNLG